MFNQSYRFFKRHAGAAFNVFFPRWYHVLLFVVVMVPLTITYGTEKVYMTVVNRTEHFVHVIIAGKSFLYVSPNHGATYETDGPANLAVSVFYAPGQGVSGSSNRTFTVSPVQHRGGCWLGGEPLFECTLDPTSPGATRWEVTADSLQIEPQELGR